MIIRDIINELKDKNNEELQQAADAIDVLEKVLPKKLFLEMQLSSLKYCVTSATFEKLKALA